MTQKTLDFLHQTYNSVVEDSETFHVLDILQGLYTQILKYTPSSKESDEYDVFTRNIESTIRIRQKTFQLTNMVSNLVFVMMYIVIWANESSNLDLDLNIIARRKALESELTKLLKKDSIRDRFGVRAVVLNKNSEEVCIDKLYSFFKILTGILAGNNRNFFNLFIQWINSNPKIDQHTKDRLLWIVNIPFKVDFVKDYIKNPKSNGYMSLQFTISIEMYSNVLPGAEFEIQLRTKKMDQVAEHGTASHTAYKETQKDLSKVFYIDDFSKVNIVGFSSYNSVADDLDGIHFGKLIVNRRISKTLVV